MIRIRQQSLIQFIIILIIIKGFAYTTVVAQNKVSISVNKPIDLMYWQITKDQSPQKILQNPPDSLWKTFSPSLIYDKYSEGNWLLRTEIVVSDSISGDTVWGLFPTKFITAYEIYWDENRIAQNGVIGVSNADEKAGIYNFNLPLPSHLLTVGKHSIILRISNYHNNSPWKWFYGGLFIGKYDAVLKNKSLSVYQAFFLIGILIIPFLFNLFLYIARKRKTEHLLFSLICLIVILDTVLNQIPILTNVSTTYIHLELSLYRIITIIFSILFPTFFIYMFSYSKKFIGAIILINLIILLVFVNFWNIFDIMSCGVLVLSSIIAVWALIKKREGSLIILIGLLAGWTTYLFDFAFTGLATVMVVCTSFSIARQFARKEKAAKDAQLRSVRLENELLKKNINPHFLLNTLTSIIVWLRKDPNSAIKLIETLAEEFRMITQISSLKQIPVRQEIDLCRAHLQIMNYRKGAGYKLETVDLVEEETIPPMIFHTLVENGLTHGYENKICGTFIIQRIKDSNCVKYIISNDGDFSNNESKNPSGFGMRYIKSRLEESYTDRWDLQSYQFENGWKTVIEIRNK